MIAFSDDLLTNQEVLKKLSSTVNCALDEAAVILSRMRPCSTLAEACSHGDITTVKKLLSEGKNINEVTEEGESLLSLACSSGYYELAQLLLAMKANVEDRGLKDMTPLMEAANAGHLDIVKLLIQHGADVNAQTSQEKKLKSSKVKNQEINMKAQQEMHGAMPPIVCPEGNTPLMFACAAGHEDIVRVLLDAGARVEDHNENGHTPLMEAASAGHVEVAKLLVERGASINTHSNEFKESALTLACYKGHLEMVRFLLAAGADREHKTDEMHTALMEASMDGHVEVARLLLDSGAQVNMPADSFESPLTLAACGGHVELAMLLLDRGANIEEVNDEGYTPLMEAAREGHEEMVALLLSQGADINAQTEETQETALTLACCGGFLDVADFLIKASADIELGASTPLMEAAQEGHIELVRYLITAGANVNATTATGDTALTYACENGHTDVADMLLQAHAKLEHESEGGRTPLMKAARAGHLCTVQFLISKGANVNKQTANNDHNPLSLACAGGHISIVELLLAHGADPTHKLKDNSTMLIEASKGGHTAVVQLLLDYPNNMTSPPPPPDVSQIPTSPLENSEAPRVPPHGIPMFCPQDSEATTIANNSYLANVQAVPRIQDLLRESLPTTTQAIPKRKTAERKTTLVKNNEAPSSSFCENAQRYHYRNKSNAAAQANSSSIQAETNSKCIMENELSSIGGGGNIDTIEETELKPSERLENCINAMMKKAEMLHPCPSEQIVQKQQILEELQRVERELQEKAQAQLLLTQHHQNLHPIGATIIGAPLTAVTSNSVNSFTAVPGSRTQQLLINSGTVVDFESLASLTDISSVSSQLGLNLQSTTATTSVPFSPAALHAQQLLYQNQQKALQQQLSNATTTTTPAAEYCKARVGKPVKQVKNNIPKQMQQQVPLQSQPNQIGPNEIKSESETNLVEDMEKMNLRNIVLNEQQQQQIQLQQQLLHQHTQQQFVLSEFTQNLTLKGTQYCEGAIAGIMHAMGGIKLTSDSTQTHAIPMYDPVTVGKALLQQQQQHLVQHQQLTQVIQQESKRQQQQLQQQQTLQQQQQNLQLQQQQQHFEKNIKLIKAKTNQVQQHSLLHVNPSPLATLVQATQSHPNLKQQLTSHCGGEACTLVGNIPIDGSGFLALSGTTTPAFPVSIAVQPVSHTLPITTSCGEPFPHNFQFTSDSSGLMVAAPARTLHDTLGEIMSGPTTQLAGTHMNLMQQSVPCVESCVNLTAAGGKSRSLSMSSLPSVNPSASLPMTFHSVTPSIMPYVPAQVSATSECISHLPHVHPTVPPPQPTSQAPPTYPPLDLNSQTDSNHDTALTLACVGGHEDLVSLLLTRGADIEHRDKKGFAPLMLAATAGHAGVVEILLNNNADIEAQSERTKDTALSLACSGGRYEVVDILLARGANKEHRNVSDYTPLSLAASGGYVNIIKLLLSHGAEINSRCRNCLFCRTGSKLGISPLMLAAMNGHAQAVKLLLDMGSDINAQIETNRNTALTLACFQGRHEVVSLLLDRKANVEHRAKTGLTPLMEAASGGYVEVGKVLLDKGADVNAPPVPSSRDTALTIAADKGHYRFVQLLLERDATVEVKNKKGNSPLWLAANGGHLEVVQLLCANSADIDSQDNRKVSCLMAAFRKGHVKVVKWMVKHVSQFPSDQEMARYMSTITDKDLLKKCSQCVDTIRIAKERQAAEANKFANSLLEEIDLERCREESRKAAAARRRERKRRKKREKQEQMRAAKAAEEESKKSEKSDSQHKNQLNHQSDQSDVEDEEDEDDDEEEEEDEEEKDDEESRVVKPSTNFESSKTTLNSPSKGRITNLPNNEDKLKESISISQFDNQNQSNQKSGNEMSRSERRRERERTKTQDKNKRNIVNKSSNSDSNKSSNEIVVTEKIIPKVTETAVINISSICSSNRNSKKRNQKQDVTVICTTIVTVPSVTTLKNSTTTSTPLNTSSSNVEVKSQTSNHKLYKSKDGLMNGISSNAVSEYEELRALFSSPRLKSKSAVEKLSLDSLEELAALDLPTDVTLSAGLRSPSAPNLPYTIKSSLTSSASPKKWQKRDEGWKEVVRSKLFNRSKKVTVPANAISRVIGRGGMNINAIREHSGAHIEVEKQKGPGDRTVIIRGSPEAVRLAQQLITALIKEPEKDLSEILSRCGINRLTNSFPESYRTAATIGVMSQPLPSAAQVSTASNLSKTTRQQIVTKTSGTFTVSVSKTTSIPPPSLPANATPPFTNQIRSVLSNAQNIRPGIPGTNTSTTPPFLSNGQNAWTGVVTGKVPTNMPRPSVPICSPSSSMSVTPVVTRITPDKSPVARQLFNQDKKNSSLPPGTTTSTKTTVSYTMAVIAQGKASKSVPANIVSVASKVTAAADTKISTISPISHERAGSAPPSTAVMHSQIALSHGSCSGPSPVQPFTTNQSPKLPNGSTNSQQGTNSIVEPRISISQTPIQSKPFVNPVATTAQTSSVTVSSSATHATLNSASSGQSTIAQEYSPFSNIFAKVAQSVWGQKDKENSKPNFASVAASGVTSVAAQVQNSNPVQSSLTLTLPQNAEPELIVDVAKAPGYRGNLHISPSASSNSSASSNPPQIGIPHSSNFGPIGSGPRSAPCTPPLGPIGPPSSAAQSARRSTPPIAPSPPPSGPHLSRSLPESQNSTLSEIPRSMSSGGCSVLPSAPHLTSQMSEVMFHHQGLGLSSHPSRLQSYPMASTLSSPGGTNTTFSQHSPLSSVGSILPEGANNGNMQVVQSNLNANAPEFASRNPSLLMTQHGPPMHHLQRLPSGAVNFQENSVPSPLATQFRPMLPNTSNLNPNFNLHTLASLQQAQAAMTNRFPYQHVPNHQQQQQQQQSGEFNPNNSNGGMSSVVGGMSHDADSLPLLSMVAGYHPSGVVPGAGNIHYPGMQPMMGMRQSQRSSNNTPSVGTSSKDEGSPMASMSPSASPQGSNLPSPTGMNMQENPNPAGTIGEDRKLPRPIGTERAQRKNPIYGGVSDHTTGIWAFNSAGRSAAEMPGTGDWIQNMQGTLNPIQQDDVRIPPAMHNFSNNRFADMMAMENNHQIDQSFQAMTGGGFPFVNGLPPHLLAPHLYQNNAAAAGPGQVDPQVEMWGMHPKVPSGDGLPQNVDHKMTWQNWSPHQA
nr:ankyrin repeat and KH domain-containing protein 1 isoform X1 [Parasteatoda tepidariorum]